MRDLKFRLIDTKSAVRIDPKEFFITDSEVFIYYSDFDNSEKADMRHHVILQYTGRKDEDGTEMYSGDIVEIDGGPTIIKNEPGGFTVAGLPLVAISNYGMKVIGNIYENPELLERN